jgi:hypothetical protein
MVDLKDKYETGEALSTDIMYKIANCSNALFNGDIYAKLDTWTNYSDSLYNIKNQSAIDYGRNWCDDNHEVVGVNDWADTFCDADAAAVRETFFKKVATFNTTAPNTVGPHSGSFYFNIFRSGEKGTNIGAGSFVIKESFNVVAAPNFVMGCPFKDEPGSPVFNINGGADMKDAAATPPSVWGLWNGKTKPIIKDSISIPAGTYTVKTASWDGHVGRETDTQPNEQFKIDIRKGTKLVTTKAVGPTTDLLDGVSHDSKENTFYSVVLTEDADNLKFYHALY